MSNTGLIASALLNAGSGALALLYGDKLNQEKAEQAQKLQSAKFQQQLLLDANKSKREATKNLMPLDDPTVQDYMAIQSGMSVPEFQKALGIVRSGEIDSSNLGFVTEANRRAKAALAVLTGGNIATNRKALADAVGAEDENKMRQMVVAGKMPTNVAGMIQGAMKGTAPFDLSSDAAMNRYTGQVTQFTNPATDSLKLGQQDTVRANTIQHMIQGLNTRLQKNTEAMAKMLPKDRASLEAENQAINGEISKYKSALDGLLKIPSESPSNAHASNSGSVPIWTGGR